jgi:hypothetical protein
MIISDEYKKILTFEHSEEQCKIFKWGATAERKIPKILKHALRFNSNNILDYGAGYGGFGINVRKQYGEEYNVIDYEPGRPDVSDKPDPQDFIICIDVLEHVEPECVESVLDDLKRVILKGGFFTISTTEAFKILSDGRNAHLTIQPWDWWLEKIKKRFNVIEQHHNTKFIEVVVVNTEVKN